MGMFTTNNSYYFHLLTDFKVEKKENNRFTLKLFSSDFHGTQIIS